MDKILTSMESMMKDLEEQKGSLKEEIKETKTQLQQLEKKDDSDTKRMLDIVDNMDQKKYVVFALSFLYLFRLFY